MGVPYHGERVVEALGSFPEAGRLHDVEIRLHGLGWGQVPVPEGDCPDGPSITLYVDQDDEGIGWCGYLTGDPEHGNAVDVPVAIDHAVTSIERRLGGGMALAA